MPRIEQRATAVGEAVNRAPSDLTPIDESTRLARENISLWQRLNLKRGDHDFHALYEGAKDKIGRKHTKGKKIDALDRYVTATSQTLAKGVVVWKYDEDLAQLPEDKALAKLEKYGRQISSYRAIAALYLLRFLTDKHTRSETAAKRKTQKKLERVKKSTLEKVGRKIERLSRQPKTDIHVFARMGELGQESGPNKERDRYIRSKVEKARKYYNEHKSTTPPIRFMTALYKEIEAHCAVYGWENPLMNLAIGDVEALKLPKLLAERLGLNPDGPKAAAIARRAKEYESMLMESGINPYGYDVKALGFEQLRNRFVDYAASFGLYRKDRTDVQGSMMADGGSHGLIKAFLVAKKYLAGMGKPAVAYFANPGFRLITEFAQTAGLTVKEVPAEARDNFFANSEEVDKFLTKNPDCKIFINTPIGNPNSTIVDSGQMVKLLKVLKKHDCILINDLTYLGTGNISENKKLAAALSTYEKRIDVFAMTKLFGRPGLRAGCAVTTHKGLGEKFQEVCQKFQPTVSYALQFEALAIWDKVTPKDRRALAVHYMKRQKGLLRYLSELEEERKRNGKPSLIDTKRPIISDAALYNFVPLNEGLDVFDFILQTGLVGVPSSGFTNKKLPDAGYVRFSIGTEETAG